MLLTDASSQGNNLGISTRGNFGGHTRDQTYHNQHQPHSHHYHDNHNNQDHKSQHQYQYNNGVSKQSAEFYKILTSLLVPVVLRFLRL